MIPNILFWLGTASLITRICFAARFGERWQKIQGMEFVPLFLYAGAVAARYLGY